MEVCIDTCDLTNECVRRAHAAAHVSIGYTVEVKIQ